MEWRRTAALGYGLAFAAVGFAVLLRTAADPVFGDRAPFAFLYPAVLVTAWYAGRAPALLAVLLGSVATHLLYPLHAFERTVELERAYWAGTGVFVMVAIAIIELTMAVRRAAAREHRAHERLDLALESGLMGVWEWNLASNDVWWSDSLDPVQGLPRGAVIQPFDVFHQLIHADDRERVDAVVAQSIAQRGGFTSEFRVVRPDGSLRWMSATGRVSCGEDGTPCRVVGISRDLTETRAAEGALREVEGRFEAMMTHAPLVVCAKDRDGRYLMVNQLFCDFAGIARADILGKTDREVFSPDHAAASTLHDEVVLSSRRPCEFENTVELAGRTITFLMIKFPLFDADGQVIAVCGIANDITDRMEAEAALKDADRRKDEFLAILAHELRNPLAPMRLALEMLRTRDGDHARAERAMDVIGRQLAHLVRLIDDLLDVSRITRGKLELRRGRVLLQDILRTAIETSRPMTDAAFHTLHVTMPDAPIELYADATRLSQVVSNLLSNAAKYTPRGGQITLEAARHGDEIVVSVSDSGIGLAPGNLDKVFEMFAQVDPLTTRSHGGLGIGLALARALVEMHGGQIDARSDGEGTGSTFTLHLPIAPSARQVTPIPEQIVATSARLRVLVADDNIDAIETLAGFLEQVGHTVQTANNGDEAIEAALTFRPDVCVLDIGMPRMDGYEVARRLREKHGELVLIALTGWGQAEDHRRSREAGFDYHLIKPVQPATLAKLLATASRAS